MLIELIYLTSSGCWNGISTQLKCNVCLNTEYGWWECQTVEKSNCFRTWTTIYVFNLCFANFESICLKKKTHKLLTHLQCHALNSTISEYREETNAYQNSTSDQLKQILMNRYELSDGIEKIQPVKTAERWRHMHMWEW